METFAPLLLSIPWKFSDTLLWAVDHIGLYMQPPLLGYTRTDTIEWVYGYKNPEIQDKDMWWIWQ